jgi:branched-chain amino acid aminotransferase
VHRYVLHNREIRDSSERSIAPGQVGFLNGWGVFSTLRVTDGVLFAFRRHYDRMQRDAETLHVPFELTPEELEARLRRLVEANAAANATLRVAVVRNRGGIFESSPSPLASELYAFTADLAHWGDGVRLRYVPNGRFGVSPFSGRKVTSWAQNLVWYEQAHQEGFDEVIFLNEAGEVSECTSANIFIIKGDQVLTPPLGTSGCLPGVTRALLLEEISVPPFTIRESALAPSDLEEADQVFITSTTRDLLPVLEVDHAPLPQSRASLKILQDAFIQYRHAYVRSCSANSELVSR